MDTGAAFCDTRRVSHHRSVDLCRGGSAAELTTTLKVVGRCLALYGREETPDHHGQTKNTSRTSAFEQSASYHRLAKTRWNDAATAPRNLKRNRKRLPLGRDLCRDLIAGFQWPSRAFNFRLYGHTQSHFPS